MYRKQHALLHPLFVTFQIVTQLQDKEVMYSNNSGNSKYMLGFCQNQSQSIKTAGDRNDCAFFKCLINVKEMLSVAPLRLVCIVYAMLFPDFTKILELMSLHTKKTLIKKCSKLSNQPT